jgi:hypothetical protein
MTHLRLKSASQTITRYTFSKLVLLSAFDRAGRELSRPELEAVVEKSQLPITQQCSKGAGASGEGGTVGDTVEGCDGEGGTVDSKGDSAEDSRYGTVGVGNDGLAITALHTYEGGDLDGFLASVRAWNGGDREGVVMRFCFPGATTSHRVKVKGGDYLNRHR